MKQPQKTQSSLRKTYGKLPHVTTGEQGRYDSLAFSDCGIYAQEGADSLERVQYGGVGVPSDILLLASVKHDGWFTHELSVAHV